MTTAAPAQKSFRAQSAALPAAGAGALALLLLGNLAMAFGPVFVRLADCGPVAAGLWRMVVPLPVLWLLARRARQPVFGLDRGVMARLVVAGVVLGLDLASWHLGIAHTRLGNATLFGNLGSLFLMIWGLVIARRRPRAMELAAVGAALAGAAILLGRSLQIATTTVLGDLLCIQAGTLYFLYFLALRPVQSRVGNWALVFHAGVFAAPIMLATALALGEVIVPHSWWAVVALALCSQVVGQGLLIRSLPRFSPLVIGLALLTQPAISVLIGLVVFHETPGLTDLVGVVLVSGALVLARL